MLVARPSTLLTRMSIRSSSIFVWLSPDIGDAEASVGFPFRSVLFFSSLLPTPPLVSKQ